MSNLTSKAKSFFEKIKTNKVLFYSLIIAIIIVIILVSSGFTSVSSDNENKSNVDYVSSLEGKLEELLSEVNGAGKVKVVITIESGNQSVLAMEKVTIESEKGVETTEKPIIVNGKTVVLTEKTPKISGVMILIDKNNLSVITKIQQATTSLLNINLSQIEILTRN